MKQWIVLLIWMFALQSRDGFASLTQKIEEAENCYRNLHDVIEMSGEVENLRPVLDRLERAIRAAKPLAHLPANHIESTIKTDQLNVFVVECGEALKKARAGMQMELNADDGAAEPGKSKRVREDERRETFLEALREKRTDTDGAFISFVPDANRAVKHLAQIISYASMAHERGRVDILPVVWELPSGGDCCVVRILTRKETKRAVYSENAKAFFTRERGEKKKGKVDQGEIIQILFPRGVQQSLTKDHEGPLSIKLDSAGRHTGHLYMSASDLQYARLHHRVFDDVNVTDLPNDRFYTYVITAKGEVSFGQVSDSWEYGVKHFHIARGRPVVAAGELYKRPNGSVLYNLKSGTFTRHIIQTRKATGNEIAYGVRKLFEIEFGRKDMVDFQEGDILQFGPPSREEMGRLCNFPYFFEKNHYYCRGVQPAFQ